MPLRFALWAPFCGVAAGVPALKLSGSFHFRADQMAAGTACADRLRVCITHVDAATIADGSLTLRR